MTCQSQLANYKSIPRTVRNQYFFTGLVHAPVITYHAIMCNINPLHEVPYPLRPTTRWLDTIVNPQTRALINIIGVSLNLNSKTFNDLTAQINAMSTCTHEWTSGDTKLYYVLREGAGDLIHLLGKLSIITPEQYVSLLKPEHEVYELLRERYKASGIRLRKVDLTIKYF